MKRTTRKSWLKPFQSLTRSVNRRNPARPRKLGVESLESRAMLTTLFVTDAGDSGDDTFRDAIDQANTDSSVSAIVIDGALTVGLDSAVEYTGGQSLSIDGAGATIEASISGANDLFISSGGADLSLSNLTFQDGDNGILVPVPSGAKGTVAVSLNNVNIRDNVSYGLHLNDQENDSDASVRLDISNSSITGNGTGLDDLDGVRVDEGGKGGIIANISNSHFDGNVADGLEVDERGPGGIKLNISGSTFNNNGLLDPNDQEDGLDVDEADAGSVWASIVDSTFNGNGDEGIDLDEEQEGNVHVELLRVTANDNEDEGIKIDEKLLEDADENPIPGTSQGNLFVSLVDVTANGSKNEEGISIKEEGQGNLIALFQSVEANNNKKEGIKIGENEDGNLHVNLRDVTANGSQDKDGIKIKEDNDGNLSIVAMGVTATGNKKFGLNVEQDDDGKGSLVLGDMDGGLKTDGVDVTEV